MTLALLDFAIRQALPADAPGAVEAVRGSIEQLCIADHHKDAARLEHWLRNKTVASFLKWFADPENFTAVAEHAGRIAGVGLIKRDGTIHLCYLRPGAQGLGIGRALVLALEAQARAWGVSELRLMSTHDACGFYEHHGYIAEGPARAGSGATEATPYRKHVAKRFELFGSSTSSAAGDTGNDRDRHYPTSLGRSVLIIADGAQGRQGATAADAVVAYVGTHIDHLASAFSAAACEAALIAADQAIVRGNSGGITTAVLIVLDGGERFVGASVGDSEAWWFRRSDLVDLTEHQNRKPFLGSGASRPVSFGPHAFEGRLVVATDGLFKYGKPEVIEQIARTAPIREVAWRLVDAVRLPSGALQDDVTVSALEQWDARISDI